MIYQRALYLFFCILSLCNVNAQDSLMKERLLNREKALQYLDSVQMLAPSKYWTHVNPDTFLANVKKNVTNPLALATGVGTNFCSYAAVTYTVLKNEPYRYAKCMIALYNNGTAKFRNIKLHPSKSILNGAGTMVFQGDLDIHYADQIWYLCLAHRFKGYLNILNTKYHKGDENTMWAAANLAKFNRMLRRLCKFTIKSKGSDLIRPAIESKRLIPFLQKLLSEGEVYLYLNNGVLRKKNHNRIQKKFPTHFVVLQSINYENEVVTIQYWDGDYKTVKQLSLSFFRDILFGISWSKYQLPNDEIIENEKSESPLP
jgi:hypothetical protein